MKIPDMIEKTLRYPGTIEYLRVLRSAGFFSRDHIEVSGNKIRPLDFTSKLLFPIWKLNKGEKDLTVMRIIIQGKLDGIDQTIKYQLIDRYDEKKNILSMARTTGYTCSSVAHLLLQKKIKKYGIIPPEYIGEDKNNFDFILDYLAKRNVKYQKSIV